MFENPKILIFASKFTFFFDQNLDFVLGLTIITRCKSKKKTDPGLITELFIT